MGSKSYCSNVNDYYSDSGTAATFVAEHSIMLTRASDSVSKTSHISNIEKPTWIK